MFNDKHARRADCVIIICADIFNVKERPTEHILIIYTLYI